MTPKDALEARIAELRKELSAHEEALRTLQRVDSYPAETSTRFLKTRPLYAMRKVLKEHGKPMSVEDLINVLLRNGIANGRKRGHHNVRISIEVNEKLGNLIVKEGIVSLPQEQEQP